MSYIKKRMLLTLITLLFLMLIPMSFASEDIAADDVAISDVNDDTIGIDDSSDIISEEYGYETNVESSTGDYVKGESYNVTVTATCDDYGNLEEDVTKGKVYVNDDSEGILTDADAMESSFDYLGSDGEYLYVVTPYLDSVDFVKGKSCFVSFDIAYSGLNFDDVYFAVFVDGSNWPIDTLYDLDPYEMTVTIDLNDYADEFDVGNSYSIVVRHTNDMYDTNFDELGVSDCLFNSMTVNVKEAEEDEKEYTGVIYVDPILGDDDNKGDASSPVATFEKAIEYASSATNTKHQIVLREGTYKEYDLNITSKLEVNGEGNVVIDAEKYGRILSIETTEPVRISGITFKNGKASEGAAIVVKNSKATINNCTFTQNDAATGAAILWDADGGTLTNSNFNNNSGRNAAVKIGKYSWTTRKSSGKNTVVENCTFEDNKNVIYGNAMALDIEEGTNNVKIIGCNFTNHKGEMGSEHGALYIKGDDALVDNCLFENNTMGMAAAIQIDGENVKVTNSKFINNTVKDGLYTRSGAIEIQNAAEIVGNIFISNGGEECIQGGAIDIVYALRGGDIIISDNVFIGNSAEYGAAIYVDGGSEDGCAFDYLAIENNRFEGNNAISGSGIYAATSEKPVDIIGNEFKNQESMAGAGIFADGVTINIDKNSMTNCSDDIFVYGGTVNGNLTLRFSAPSEVFVGEEFIITAALTDDGNNNINGSSVKFTANNIEIVEISLIDGNQANYTADKIGEITISGSTDLLSRYKINVVDSIVKVVRNPEIKENVTINATYSADNVSSQLDIVLPSDATGIILVDVGGNKYYGELFEGKATVNLAGLKDGEYTANVTYLGDDIYNHNSTIVDIKITTVTASINVTLPSNIKAGESVDVVVDLPSDAEGNVTVSVDDSEVRTVAVVNGSANIALVDLASGVHVIETKYSGDGHYAPETKYNAISVESKLDTLFTVDKSFTRVANDYYAGERGAVLYANLTDINGNPLVNKSVQIAVNGKIYNVITDEQGRAGLRISFLVAKTYTYALSFQGDDDYNAAPLAITKLTVTKKKTSIKASAKTFKVKATKKITVTLKTTKNPYNKKTYLKAGKKLTLTVKGKKYTAKMNKKGKATFTIKLTKKGKYTAKIKFAGDKTYKASSKSIKITVK